MDGDLLRFPSSATRATEGAITEDDLRDIFRRIPGMEPLGPYCDEALLVARDAARRAELTNDPTPILEANGQGVVVRIRPSNVVPFRHRR